MIGSTQNPVIETNHDNLSILLNSLNSLRFVEGRLLDYDNDVCGCGVLVPVGRIQLILEVI